MMQTLRVLFSGGLLALLGLGLGGLESPAFASTERCPGTTPPVCRSVRTCTDWTFCGAGPGLTACCGTEQTDFYYFADPS